MKDGDRVKLDSGFGQVEGIVEGSNVQRLTPDGERYDPITGLALQTAIPVNISHAGRGYRTVLFRL